MHTEEFGKMRNSAIGLGTVTLLAILAAVFSLFPLAQAAPQEDGGAAPAAGAGRGNRTPPGPPHDPHDLNGVWLGPIAIGGGGRGGAPSKANTIFSQTPVSMTAAGLAQYNANKPALGPRGIRPA